MIVNPLGIGRRNLPEGVVELRPGATPGSQLLDRVVKRVVGAPTNEHRARVYQLMPHAVKKTPAAEQPGADAAFSKAPSQTPTARAAARPQKGIDIGELTRLATILHEEAASLDDCAVTWLSERTPDESAESREKAIYDLFSIIHGYATWARQLDAYVGGLRKLTPEDAKSALDAQLATPSGLVTTLQAIDVLALGSSLDTLKMKADRMLSTELNFAGGSDLHTAQIQLMQLMQSVHIAPDRLAPRIWQAAQRR